MEGEAGRRGGLETPRGEWSVRAVHLRWRGPRMAGATEGWPLSGEVDVLLQRGEPFLLLSLIPWTSLSGLQASDSAMGDSDDEYDRRRRDKFRRERSDYDRSRERDERRRGDDWNDRWDTFSQFSTPVTLCCVLPSLRFSYNFIRAIHTKSLILDRFMWFI